MPYPSNRPFNEVRVHCFTTSVGTTPLVAYAAAPCVGKIIRCGVIIYGALTGTLSVAVAINGVAVGGSPMASGSNPAAGTVVTLLPSSPTNVNEDDAISFTPSGGTGASVGAMFFAVVQRTVVGT